jgi:Na+/H+ antiporter NhaA
VGRFRYWEGGASLLLETYYKRLVDEIREFMRLESAAGVVLLAAAVLALIANNSGLARYYDLFLSTRSRFAWGRSISTSRCCSG